MNQAKSFSISKHLVWKAYKKVKANRGAAGVDGISLEEYEENLKDNLYKLWNRMSSESYFPPAVRLVEIPKKDGGKRPLGIPTVGDRVAQMVVKMLLEPLVEPHFHADSYGYRHGKSAIEAVGMARKRCWEHSWILDVDIRGFFDNIDQELMMKAVKEHTDIKWILLYIERWLKSPMEKEDGTLIERKKGTPQGGVISPLLANLFLHYAFDIWMKRKYPKVVFERYADDIVVHCDTESEARQLMEVIRERLKECNLELHLDKTKIVYCKGESRKGDYPNIKFDFLGYTFQPRSAINRWDRLYLGYLPAVSNMATKKMRRTIKGWKLHLRNGSTLEEIAEAVNPVIRGWINYYGKYYKSQLGYTLYCLNSYLSRWVIRKYKRFRNQQFARANEWLGRIALDNPALFAHWSFGFKPAAR